MVTGYGRELRSSHCHKEEGLLISLVSDPWASPTVVDSSSAGIEMVALMRISDLINLFRSSGFESRERRRARARRGENDVDSD